MRVRLDLAAKQEIHQAALFYEDCREGLGQEFVDSVESAFEQIQQHPDRVAHSEREIPTLSPSEVSLWHHLCCRRESNLYSSRHASETQAWLLGLAGQRLKVKQDNRPEKAEMMKYPRSPKALLGGIAHLGRFIDKIRLRHAGKIQDYNYITVGFDKYLIDFLQIDPKAFEQRVLAGGDG